MIILALGLLTLFPMATLSINANGDGTWLDHDDDGDWFDKSTERWGGAIAKTPQDRSHGAMDEVTWRRKNGESPIE